MINELYTLSRTLSDMDIATERWHRAYKLIPKVTPRAPCIRLWLSSEGAVESASLLDAGLAAGIRKYGNNQASFPAFNLVPLYRITDTAHIAAYQQLITGKTALDMAAVRSWCVSDNWHGESNELPDMDKKAFACIVTKGAELREQIEASGLGAQNAVSALLSAVDTYAEDRGKFREALEACLLSRLAQGRHIELYLKLLFHIGSADKEHGKDRGTLSVVLDVLEFEAYGAPVAHERTTRWINQVLLAAEREAKGPEGGQQQPGGYDAFGAAYEEVGEPMPGVKLQGIDVTLRAMFNAQACQYRYGKIDDASYPIVKANRAATQSALAWIGAADKQGDTWQRMDGSALLFVYPSAFPETPLNLVSLFAPSDGQGASDTGEARFLEIAQKVISALRGLPPREMPARIQLFSLRKMDKARTKVVLSRNCSPEWLVQAAEAWQEGCQNLPALAIRVFPERRKTDTRTTPSHPVPMEPVTPYPLWVPRIVNNVWKQSGELAQGKSGAKRMQHYQGIELLIEPANRGTAAYYLNVLLTHALGLVQHVGNQQHRQLACTYKEGREVGLLFSTIGLLLYQCGVRRDDYMENSAFLVGQLLKISDELHTMYCLIQRRGDIPAQLAGNAAFVAATETPMQALAQLGPRMNPYIAWAKQYRHRGMQEKGRESWRAAWLLNLYEEASSSLHPLLEAHTTYGDPERAQVFIGYLAAFPTREAPAQAVDHDGRGGEAL